MRDATVTPNGDRIRWVEVPGKEPVRLYLHGLGSSSPVYYAAAAAHPLLTGHRALLLDLLGFGISDRPTDFPYTLEAHADAVAAAVRAAGAERVEVIGHSLGGAVAVLLAHRHPGLVGRLVLVDSVLDPVVQARTPGGSGLATFTEEEYLAAWVEAGGAVGLPVLVGHHAARRARGAAPHRRPPRPGDGPDAARAAVRPGRAAHLPLPRGRRRACSVRSRSGSRGWRWWRCRTAGTTS